MSNPLVSVIIPTYNRPGKVVGAMESVLEQTYEPIEIIVVDDCSPEPIERRVNDMNMSGSRTVQCLRHEVNKGAAAARATGIKASDGEFVAFLDDDDRWQPQKLQKQVEALEEWGPTAGVAYCGMNLVDCHGEKLRTQIPSKSGDLTKTLLCRNLVGSYSTVMVRQEAIEDTGLPDERFPSWQDLEWYIRLSINWEFVAIPKPLAIIYQAETHEQISDNFEAIESESYELFVKKFQPIAAGYGKLFERKMLGWAAFRVGGYNALRTGNFGKAREYLLNSVVIYPLVLKFWMYLLVAIGGKRIYRITKQIKRTFTD